MTDAEKITALRLALQQAATALRMLTEPDMRQKPAHVYAQLRAAEATARRTIAETE